MTERDKQTRNPIEIRVTANGYMVRPVDNGNGLTNFENDVHVFSSFESLVGWLNQELKRPKEQAPRSYCIGCDAFHPGGICPHPRTKP